MNMLELLQPISALPSCKVYPPLNHTLGVRQGLILPQDIHAFYQLCDGIDLFLDQDYSYSIVHSTEFALANPVIIGQQAFQIVSDDDISHDWYVIAHDSDQQYLTIDLNPARLGRCYDSFSGRHAVPKEAQIIAMSFTDLLKRLVENRGDYPYWLKDGFAGMGMAYDV